MKSDDVILIGVKNRVMAISKHHGGIIWSSMLPGGMGASFVTVISDGTQVFAHASGHLHCMDFATGRIIWSNELSGCGYGVASLAIPGSTAAPEPAVAQAIIAAQQAEVGAYGA